MGVSGGADSLTLVDCLSTLGYSVVVAHFDHRLRTDSQADADFVCAYALKNGLVYETGSGEVSVFARDHSFSIEEAARQMRYTFLFEIANKHNAQAVAVGHTADDQVETMLMHVLRGAGLGGLKGMPWRGFLEVFDTGIPLIRPLLGVWRTETEDWCKTRGLVARIDPSNRDTVYARNRLRQVIIPLLESFSPQARHHILQLVKHLQGDYRILKNLTEEKFLECLKDRGDGYVCFDLAAFSKLDPALQAWVLRQAAFQLVKELRDFNTSAVERCLEVIASSPTSWQGDLPGGIRLRVDGKRLYLMTWSVDLPGTDLPQLQAGFLAELPFPGRVEVGNDWHISSEWFDNPENAHVEVLENSDPNQAWVDADKLPAPLSVSCAHAGQRFQPLGMIEGSQKLSDFWVNVKLPRRVRAGWPVVFSGDEIVWLPGFRLAHPFRLGDESKAVLHLRLARHVPGHN
ncbi:MAG: tRNA lysidine(34) synthetase TilS [Anaerolineaceae bacterium]